MGWSAGNHGFLRRDILLAGEENGRMRSLVLRVQQGGSDDGPAIASRVVGYFSRIRQQQPAAAFPELTEREREILQLMAQHLTNLEIARQLHLSPKTVRNYTSNIFAKLQVAGRAEAVIRARDAGMG